jgi:hypothetical protein
MQGRNQRNWRTVRSHGPLSGVVVHRITPGSCFLSIVSSKHFTCFTSQPRKADGSANHDSSSASLISPFRRSLSSSSSAGSGVKVCSCCWSEQYLACILMLAQWHPEAEAKVSHNLRLRDEESAEALSATLHAICEKQVHGSSALLRLCDSFTLQKHMDSKLDQILLLLKQHTALPGQPSSHA